MKQALWRTVVLACSVGAIGFFVLSHGMGQTNSGENTERGRPAQEYAVRGVGSGEDRFNEMEKLANEMSAAGWRLHTADSVIRQDEQMVTTLWFVRDRER